MRQSCISLGFLSQNSLWKLSQFSGYKGVYIVGWEGNAKRQFLPNMVKWRLGLAACPSREFKSRRNGLASLGLLSCSTTAGATLQLPLVHLTCQQLATCSREPPANPSRETLLLCTNLSFSLHSLHTLPLHESHLNTGLLSAKLQANWHGIKPIRWLINFSFTISPFGYSVTKP